MATWSRGPRTSRRPTRCTSAGPHISASSASPPSASATSSPARPVDLPGGSRAYGCCKQQLPRSKVHMLILMLFALIAGAGTAITPCVLPVLPALLSASALGGRRRPLGIVVGLAGTFTVAIVALAQLVKGVGIAAGGARWLAIVVLIGFGIVLLVPELAERVQAPLSRLARFGPNR